MFPFTSYLRASDNVVAVVGGAATATVGAIEDLSVSVGTFFGMLPTP